MRRDKKEFIYSTEAAAKEAAVFSAEAGDPYEVVARYGEHVARMCDVCKSNFGFPREDGRDLCHFCFGKEARK